MANNNGKRRTKRSEPTPHDNAREILKKIEEEKNKPKYVPIVGDHVQIHAEYYIGGGRVAASDKENGMYVLRYNPNNSVVSLCRTDGVFVDALHAKDVSLIPDEEPQEAVGEPEAEAEEPAQEEEEASKE